MMLQVLYGDASNESLDVQIVEVRLLSAPQGDICYFSKSDGNVDC